jgi:hypothetical protein
MASEALARFLYLLQIFLENWVKGGIGVGGIRPGSEFRFVTFAATLGALITAQDRECGLILKRQTSRRKKQRQGDDTRQNKKGDSQRQPMTLPSYVLNSNLGH